MIFLADENFPRPTVLELRTRGYDVLSAAEDSAGAPDEHVLSACARTQRTLLTLDKDFGELVFRRMLPAEWGVILFRVETDSPDAFTRVVLEALASATDWRGAFAVVGERRIRVRRMK